MRLLHVAQHWLQADPPGMNHLLVGVFAVAAIWIMFERMGFAALKFR
jgi:hypothetical protein